MSSAPTTPYGFYFPVDCHHLGLGRSESTDCSVLRTGGPYGGDATDKTLALLFRTLSHTVSLDRPPYKPVISDTYRTDRHIVGQQEKKKKKTGFPIKAFGLRVHLPPLPVGRLSSAAPLICRRGHVVKPQVYILDTSSRHHLSAVTLGSKRRIFLSRSEQNLFLQLALALQRCKQLHHLVHG